MMKCICNKNMIKKEISSNYECEGFFEDKKNHIFQKSFNFWYYSYYLNFKRIDVFYNKQIKSLYINNIHIRNINDPLDEHYNIECLNNFIEKVILLS